MKTFLKVWIGIALIAIGFGIGICILAVALGGSFEDVPTYVVKESYDNVENIDMQIDYGEINIVEGDTFSIDAENLLEDGFESYVSDGTWYINDEHNNDFNFFGLRFSAQQLFRWEEDLSPKITITIPKGFVADEFNLEVGAGEVDVDEVNAVKGNISVGAGRLYINRLAISDSSQYNVGAGEMVLKDTSINNITLDCGVGDVVIEGTVTGDNDISCGLGSVDLDLIGDDSDYSYDISAGIGEVKIDGRSYHDIANNIHNNNASGNYLRLDTGIGSITVDFN